MAFEITNMFNTAESEVVSYLQGKSNITAMVSSGNIHEKLRQDANTYSKAELPAIAVGSVGFSPGSPRPLKSIIMQIEVINIGADLAAIDGNVKQIAAEIINTLERESPVYRGNGISQQFEDVRVTSGNILQFQPSPQELLFVVAAGIQVELDIIN